VDFAKAKSIAVRRKQGYFPLGNPKTLFFGGLSVIAPTF
jgi:hypothetical protein